MNTDALTRDNPDLLALEAAYRASPYYDVLLKGSAWETFQAGINMQQFRGECQYLAQLQFNASPEQYAATFDYVRSIDTEGYLERLGEDGSFGCVTFEREGITYSRDLLDSICEIYFLRETLGLTSGQEFDVLDIGGGYGRFAYRFTDAFDNMTVKCVDAVPVSTFLCDFYLWDYLDWPEVAVSVPLHEIHEPYIFKRNFNLSVNIHSWSECTASAINFWMDYISDLRIPYLFVVPHDSRFVCVNPDGTHPSFKPIIEAHGYKLVVERPKFPDGINGIYSEAVYALFERA